MQQMTPYLAVTLHAFDMRVVSVLALLSNCLIPVAISAAYACPTLTQARMCRLLIISRLAGTCNIHTEDTHHSIRPLADTYSGDIVSTIYSLNPEP